MGKNFHVLGCLKLKIRGKFKNISIGDNVQFMGDVDLRNREEGKIKIGDRAKIDQGVRIISAQNATIEIGRGSKIMFYSNINAGADIRIGEKTGIAAFCMINSSSHRTDFGKSYMDQAYDHSPIVIGNDVWLGSHSSVLPGVKIGNGAIISTHTVVVNEVMENRIVGGIPARVLGERKPAPKTLQTQEGSKVGL